MQVFISEVAPWIDILNKDKQFSNMMPDLALKSPMLLNALLACGTMHLSLTQQSQQSSSSQPSGNSNSNVNNKTQCSYYYDLATMELWRNLEQLSSDRNAAECATTATVLNAYDIMMRMSSGGNPSASPFPLSRSQQQGQRVAVGADYQYHIAGCARALVKECIGWNANSNSMSLGTGARTGVGEACFWFNACMEVLDCLQPTLVQNHSNSMNSWQTQTPTSPTPTVSISVWDPDQWGLDTNVERWTTATTANPSVNANSTGVGMGIGMGMGSSNGTGSGSGEQELWAQRILYALAKVVNFCADAAVATNNSSISRYAQETIVSPHDEQMRLQRRFTEWKSLNDMCDTWKSNCPRSMRPYGYAHSSSSGSLFPNVW